MHSRLRTPNRSRETLVALFAATALAASALSSAALADDADAPDEARDRGAIRISDTGVVPREYQGETDRLVSWANEDERYAVLEFDAAFEHALECEAEIRPELYRGGDGRVLSLPIRKNLFALPCRLEPGRYPYRVHLLDDTSVAGRLTPPPGVVRNPARTFEADLVVR